MLKLKIMDTTKDKLIRLLELRVFNADDLADEIDDLYKQEHALQLLQPDVSSRFYCQDEQEQEKKAKELYEMFYFTPDQDGFNYQNKYRAKVQASLCCNEIIKACHNSDWWKGVMQFISDI